MKISFNDISIDQILKISGSKKSHLCYELEALGGWYDEIELNSCIYGFGKKTKTSKIAYINFLTHNSNQEIKKIGLEILIGSAFDAHQLRNLNLEFSERNNNGGKIIEFNSKGMQITLTVTPRGFVSSVRVIDSELVKLNSSNIKSILKFERAVSVVGGDAYLNFIKGEWILSIDESLKLNSGYIARDVISCERFGVQNFYNESDEKWIFHDQVGQVRYKIIEVYSDDSFLIYELDEDGREYKHKNTFEDNGLRRIKIVKSDGQLVKIVYLKRISKTEPLFQKFIKQAKAECVRHLDPSPVANQTPESSKILSNSQCADQSKVHSVSLAASHEIGERGVRLLESNFAKITNKLMIPKGQFNAVNRSGTNTVGVGVTTSQSGPSTECHTGLASNHEQNPAGIPPSPSASPSRPPQKP